VGAVCGLVAEDKEDAGVLGRPSGSEPEADAAPEVAFVVDKQHDGHTHKQIGARKGNQEES